MTEKCLYRRSLKKDLQLWSLFYKFSFCIFFFCMLIKIYNCRIITCIQTANAVITVSQHKHFQSLQQKLVLSNKPFIKGILKEKSFFPSLIDENASQRKISIFRKIHSLYYPLLIHYIKRHLSPMSGIILPLPKSSSPFFCAVLKKEFFFLMH